MSKLDITLLAGALGAEVRGLELAGASADDAAAVKDLLLEHHVLFFPDQHLSPEAHVEFGRHFGELEGHPHLQNVESTLPEIFELVATRGGIADEWHSDISFQESPSIMAILNMVKCPTVGGDTMWSNMHRAYEELSAPLRDLCDGLTAVHNALPHGKPEKATIHPVVRVHPETGRRSLFVNEHFTRRIVELSHEESEHLLSYLFHWVTNPRFIVRYRWHQGTIGMWDNRCTQHFVVNDFSEERIIQRVTVMGDVVSGAQQPRWEPYVRGRHAGATSRQDRLLKTVLKERAHDEEQRSAQVVS